MKRIIRLFLVLSLLSLLSGCAYYSKMAVPGEPAQQGKYEILKHIKKSVTGTRFLTIPVNIPSSAQIIKDEVAAVGGDGVINLEVTFSEFNFFLLSFPIVEVEADVVKIAEKVTDIHRSEEGLISEQLDIKSQMPDKEPNYFEEWKKEISRYRDLQLQLKWKSFAKRNSINLSWKEWVQSLSSTEYENYLQSTLTARKWLGERLEKSKEVEQVSQVTPGFNKSESIEKWELILTKSPDGKLLGSESGLKGNLILTKDKNVKLIFDQSGKKVEFEGKFYYDDKGSMVIEVQQIGTEALSKISYKTVLIKDSLLILTTETGREYHWKK